MMPRLSAEHPLLEDAEGLKDDHSLVFVVDANEYKPPTYYSFKDIKRRTIGRSLTELPFTSRFGADRLPRDGEVQGRARQALRDGRAAAHLPRPRDAGRQEEGGGAGRNLAVKRKGIFVSHWPLRGANRKGHARFLRSFDTVAENAMESRRRRAGGWGRRSARAASKQRQLLLWLSTCARALLVLL